MCRLTPSTFLAPSNPRGPATGDDLTLEESATTITAAAGLRRVRGHMIIDGDHGYRHVCAGQGVVGALCDAGRR